MDSMPLEFKQIFDLTGLCNSIFIAGGAVVSIEKATDIDVWFGKNNEKGARDFLRKCTVSYLKSSQYAGANIFGEAYISGIPKLIQVMVTSDVKPEDTLSTFDISTHQWAYTSRGRLIKGPQATEWHEPVRILHANNGNSTFSRYLKICTRYGLAIDEDLLHQFSQVIPEVKEMEDPVKYLKQYGVIQ